MIDGYRHRHEVMKESFQDYVNQHATIPVQLTDRIDVGIDYGLRLQPPSRIPDSELKTARRRVVDASYQFLRRCFKEKMIDESGFRAGCQRVGTSIDPMDLR